MKGSEESPEPRDYPIYDFLDIPLKRPNGRTDIDTISIKLLTSFQGDSAPTLRSAQRLSRLQLIDLQPFDILGQLTQRCRGAGQDRERAVVHPDHPLDPQ